MAYLRQRPQFYSNTPYTASYALDGFGRTAYVDIADGRRRTVSFASTSDGQVLKREERSAATTNPLDLHQFVSGVELSNLTNNGNNDPAEIDYNQITVTDYGDSALIPSRHPPRL